MNHYCYRCGAPAVPKGTGYYYANRVPFEDYFCNLCKKGFRVINEGVDE